MHSTWYKKAKENIQQKRVINIDPNADPIPVQEINYKSLPEGELYQIYEKYFSAKDEALLNIIDDFKNMRGRGRQHWDVLSLDKVKRVWADFTRLGFVRDQHQRAIDEIADSVVSNVAKIKANTELAGHTQADPEELLKDLDIQLTQKQWQKFWEWMDTKFGAPYSDFAIDSLESDVIRIRSSKTYEEKIVAIDRLFNRIHQRGDLAALFIEKGRKGLQELYDQGLVRPPEKDKSLFS